MENQSERETRDEASGEESGASAEESDPVVRVEREVFNPSERDVSDSGDAAHGTFVFRQAWLVVALLLLAAAGVVLSMSHTDAAFVCAVLGVCAWFLNVRSELKRKHRLKKAGRRNWEAQ